MKKDYRYWIWNESLNDTEFKIGELKEQIISKKLIATISDNDGFYDVISGYPDSVSFDEDNTLRAIYFAKRFLKTFRSELWEMNTDEFIESINQHLVPCNKDFSGIILCVVFKDYFPRIALIKKN